MKDYNGYTVTKEFLLKKINDKLSKKVYLKNIDKTLTFTIDYGDDCTYMVYCEETGYSMEDNNWQTIKHLQNNPLEWEDYNNFEFCTFL